MIGIDTHTRARALSLCVPVAGLKAFSSRKRTSLSLPQMMAPGYVPLHTHPVPRPLLCVVQLPPDGPPGRQPP